MMQRIGRLALLWLTLFAVFAALMVLVYAVPNSWIKSHVRASAEQIRLEGHPYTPLVGLSSLMPDNFTDALMLNQALNSHDAGPVQAAFGSYMQTVGPEADDAIADLEVAVAGEGAPTSYARYWHGYQVWLRPLLVLFDLRAIRFLNAIVMTICVGVVSALMAYRLGAKAMVAFVAALLSAGIVIVPVSLQFTSVFYVMLLGVAMVTLGMDGEGTLRLDLETFLVLGALTAFLDLLTAPVLTLGLPLVVLLVGRMRSERESRALRQLRESARVSAAWALAYGGTWAAKWALSSVVLGRNVLVEAMSVIAHRLDGAEAGVIPQRVETIVRNVAMLFPLFGFNQTVGLQWGVVAATLAVPTIVVILVVFTLRRHLRTDKRLSRLTGLLIALALPFGWYLVLNDHSWVHFWMTYRNLAIAVFVVVYGVLYAYEPGYLSTLKARLEGHLRGETNV
ncbi:MAG: hypothetical protein D9V44_09370 [Actinobacteria bacterium]|nr:MAG: hypothetical protein D9V44_09370 [Actinomycetota bacterium]